MPEKRTSVFLHTVRFLFDTASYPSHILAQYNTIQYNTRTRNQYFGGPPTVIIDPDLPLLEVFWRSALPWAHVEGVAAPNR